jgi:ABC-type nickel/cobalt efflux system permease component RcnA
MLSLLTITLIIIAIFLFFKGCIQTFQRCWWLALLSIVLVVPIPAWTCWALVEAFLPTPEGSTDFVELLGKQGD